MYIMVEWIIDEFGLKNAISSILIKDLGLLYGSKICASSIIGFGNPYEIRHTIFLKSVPTKLHMYVYCMLL